MSPWESSVMKGIIFVHFLEIIENEFGLKMADQIIESSNLSTKGAYTTVGTYDHDELLQLVGQLSRLTKTPVDALLEKFGIKMFTVLSLLYPGFIENMDDVFTLLKNVESIIHVEVKKLYPDAELPQFQHNFRKKNEIELIYSSPRPFESLAKGLIQGCINYYAEPVVIKSMEILCRKKNQIRFVIKKKGALHE